MTEPRRPFTLRDAMLLVAAAAIGFAADHNLRHIGDLAKVGHNEKLVVLATPVLATFTLFFVVLRLSQPHPRRRKLMKQPGAVAAVSACASLVIAAIDTVSQRAFIWDEMILSVNDEYDLALTRIYYLGALIGKAVLVSWVVLWCGGRFRPERTWVDTMGIFIGVAWIIIGFVAM